MTSSLGYKSSILLGSLITKYLVLLNKFLSAKLTVKAPKCGSRFAIKTPLLDRFLHTRTPFRISRLDSLPNRKTTLPLLSYIEPTNASPRMITSRPVPYPSIGFRNYFGFKRVANPSGAASALSKILGPSPGIHFVQFSLHLSLKLIMKL
jgi:hypothetical protein